MDGAIPLECNDAVAVELELVEPLLAWREESVRSSSIGSMNCGSEMKRLAVEVGSANSSISPELQT